MWTLGSTRAHVNGSWRMQPKPANLGQKIMRCRFVHVAVFLSSLLLWNLRGAPNRSGAKNSLCSNDYFFNSLLTPWVKCVELVCMYTRCSDTWKSYRGFRPLLLLAWSFCPNAPWCGTSRIWQSYSRRACSACQGLSIGERWEFLDLASSCQFQTDSK